MCSFFDNNFDYIIGTHLNTYHIQRFYFTQAFLSGFCSPFWFFFLLSPTLEDSWSKSLLRWLHNSQFMGQNSLVDLLVMNHHQLKPELVLYSILSFQGKAYHGRDFLQAYHLNLIMTFQYAKYYTNHGFIFNKFFSESSFFGDCMF